MNRGIDLIRDGLPAHVLSDTHGGKALFGTLVSTAMWAQNRGDTEAGWCGLLDEPTSALGRQNRTQRNGTSEAPKRSRDRLTRAWAAAAAHTSEAPAWTREEAQQHARATAQAVRDLVADPDNDLTDNERAVLDHVAKVADERGSDRLTLPRGDYNRSTGVRTGLVLDTGLGVTALRIALDHLARRGLLTKVEKGRPREKGRPMRANVYRLGTDLTPKAELAVPLARVSGAPLSDGSVPPARVSGAPLPEALAAYLSTPEGAAHARQILDRTD